MGLLFTHEEVPTGSGDRRCWSWTPVARGQAVAEQGHCDCCSFLGRGNETNKLWDWHLTLKHRKLEDRLPAYGHAFLPQGPLACVALLVEGRCALTVALPRMVNTVIRLTEKTSSLLLGEKPQGISEPLLHFSCF